MRVYTDYELKNQLNSNIFTQPALTIDLTNLQSANDVFTNRSNGVSPSYTPASAIACVVDYSTIKALYISTDIPINALSSSGRSDLLKKIMIKNSDDIFTEQEKHYVDVVGQHLISKLGFKLVDLYGNVINLEGKDMSFSFVVKQ